MQFLLGVIGDVAATLNTPSACSQALARGRRPPGLHTSTRASSTRQFLPVAGISVPLAP